MYVLSLAFVFIYKVSLDFLSMSTWECPFWGEPEMSSQELFPFVLLSFQLKFPERCKRINGSTRESQSHNEQP